MWHKMIASWPGPDPAIHGCATPRHVDARIKSGHDDLVCVIYPLVIPRFMRGIHISNSRTTETVRQ